MLLLEDRVSSKLLEIVHSEASKIDLEISIKKSKIISPDEDVAWVIHEEDGTVALTLEKVTVYKYLGVKTHQTCYSTQADWEQKAQNTANKYKWACLKISKTGPDRVKLGITAWNIVAIPSISTTTQTSLHIF